MKNTLHIVALLLFALTQCFAPLVHAHVDGVESGNSIHTHDAPHHFSSPETTSSHCESQELQCVSIDHEYQRSVSIVITDTLAATIHPIPLIVTGDTAEPHESIRLFVSAFQKPHTQAPPLPN